MLHWTWTAQVFFTLHTLTFLMKIHSYAFYNGHLSETERRLSKLDTPGPTSLDAAVRYPESYPRRQSLQRTHADPSALTKLRDDLATELTSPLGRITYPQNLTLHNFADYILCPTLCYELEYPRNKEIRWTEVGFKTAAVFGCIFLLTLTSEEFIVPVLSDASAELQVVDSLSDKALIFAEAISMLLFPFMVTILLVFLVIFEYALNSFGELTRFADRHFYSDWWNSCDWYPSLSFKPQPDSPLTVVKQDGILPRMEHPRPQLPPSPRLLLNKMLLLATCRHVHNLLHQLRSPRTRHELYHQETARIRISVDDASVADCGGAKVEVSAWKEDFECMFSLPLVASGRCLCGRCADADVESVFLVVDDIWTFDGESLSFLPFFLLAGKY